MKTVFFVGEGVLNKYKIGSFYGLVKKQPQLLEFWGGCSCLFLEGGSCLSLGGGGSSVS